MNIDGAKKIAEAVLYEGYMLYPYRPSAMKNRQRWSFGILYPQAYHEVRNGTERAALHTECLIEIAEEASLRVDLQLRFLQLRARRVAQENDGQLQTVDSLCTDGRRIESWEEGIERTVECNWTPERPMDAQFSFPEACDSERLTNARGELLGFVTHTQAALSGQITISSQPIGERLWQLAIDCENTTPARVDLDRDSALLNSLLSAHAILAVQGGQFISLLDPPPKMQAAASQCRNVGNYPVLVGAEPDRSVLLCSPIILYDYPQVAPESAGDFFDGTEMDEMLTLRVITMTDEEKNEMRISDPRLSELLRRTEESAREQLMRTHGTIRSISPAKEAR